MRIVIVYNDPVGSRYDAAGEQEAALGVLTEVSAVDSALRGLGHAVELLPLSISTTLAEVTQELRRLGAELVFNLFEGFTGYPETESALPEALELAGIRYTGCPPAALKLALNKAKTSAVLIEHGVEAPEFQLLRPDEMDKFHLRFPCIVKPNTEDASHGLTADSVVSGLTALRRQVDGVSAGHGEALVEEYIDGREFNVTLTGNSAVRVLGLSEIAFSLPSHLPKILTYAGKWDIESEYYLHTTPVCPPPVSDTLKRRIFDTAERAYRVVGCRGYARVDMRLDARDRLAVVDVNPNPDISPGSGALLHAASAGLDYPAFIQTIVNLALEDS